LTEQTKEQALEELRQVRHDLASFQGVRDRAITWARIQGASLREIAEAAGVSKDTVTKVLKRS